MHIIYNIGISFYYLIVSVVSIWNQKAGNWIRGRKNWREKLRPVFSEKDEVIWFHCASLGEFEQGRPIIEKVRKEHPEYKLLLTFFSPSGYEKRKDFDAVDHVCYLPVDTFRNARDFLQMVPVKKVVFIKYEFWYHFLKRINTEGIPLFLASGNFRSSQLFFRWYGAWYRKVFSYFTQIFVQDSESKTLLNSFGIEKVIVTGDTRFDRVVDISGNVGQVGRKRLFAKDIPVIVVGSSWEKDEIHVKDAYTRLGEMCNWIIAPHEPTDQNVSRLKKWFPDYLLYSDMEQDQPAETNVIIVNTIGHLSSLYQFGSVAYIGGGFGKGIHNILEATALGLPVLFGPNFRRFREAKDLHYEGAAFIVENPGDVYAQIYELLTKQSLLKKSGQIAKKYTFDRIGATEKIVDFIC